MDKNPFARSAPPEQRHAADARTSNPNRPDDPQYILRLVGQVVHVSLETVKTVRELPEFGVETSDESFI